MGSLELLGTPLLESPRGPSSGPTAADLSSLSLASSGTVSWDKPRSRSLRRVVINMLIGRVLSGKVRVA